MTPLLKPEARIAAKANHTALEKVIQNRPYHRTEVMALDLSKTLNVGNYATLFEDVENTRLRPSLKFWIVNNMCGRQSCMEFQNKKSKASRVLPKVGVISENVWILTFRNSVLSRRHWDRDLCIYLAELGAFFHAKKMKIWATKSTASLVTTWSAEMIIADKTGIQIQKSSCS